MSTLQLVIDRLLARSGDGTTARFMHSPVT